jgi:hypothetical protein
MTPEEALAILDKFNAPPSDEQLENAYIWWHVQRDIAWGGLTQSREAVDHAKCDRSTELAALHGQITTAERSDPPRPCIEQKLRREHLLQEIEKEAWQELHEKGLPEQWQRGQRKN